jgi:hypothetical protein
MPELQFAVADDDLPRTFRREREAREREARERETREREARDRHANEDGERIAGDNEPIFLHRDYVRPVQDYAVAVGPAGTLDRLDLSFLHLMFFFLKAAFAAIPALMVFAALIWIGGQMLTIFFPELGRMQVLIHFPK